MNLSRIPHCLIPARSVGMQIDTDASRRILANLAAGILAGVTEMCISSFPEKRKPYALYPYRK